MPTIAERGTAGGKTSLTAAVTALTASKAAVLVTVDVADILAAVGLSAAEKRGQALRRLLEELYLAVDTDTRPDATIDQQVTDATARAAKEKAARPTGTL